MLDPTSRRLFFDSLRPPDGYSLDFALGTTYTLDLLALIAAPLAFTFSEWEDKEGRPALDPVALLQSLRTNADRLRIFHQWGGIHPPPRYERLYHYLEDSLVAVRPTTGHGVFHAKVWVLRYVRDDAPVRYRLLNLSRNLTFDHAWDLALVMEGELTTRSRAYAVNHPLGDFVAALPKLAKQTPDEKTLELISRIQDEVRRVDFVIPEGFDEYQFWPLGLNGRPKWPFLQKRDRVLVVSPFVADGFLSRLLDKVDRPHESVLISRPEELCALSQSVRQSFGQTLVLSSAIQSEEEVREDSLSGLHAKLFIAESGWNAHVWAGSANATDAAFNNNIEFLVELVGKRSRVGIDSFLQGDNGDTSIRSLLEPFAMPDILPECSETEKKLDALLDDAEDQLASRHLSLQVTTQEDGRFVCDLQTDRILMFPAPVVGSCWPVSASARKTRISDSVPTTASFGALSFESLTPFVVFALSASQDAITRARQFVLAVPMEGAPSDRRQRLMHSILSDKKTLLRLLFMLLSNETLHPLSFGDPSDNGPGEGNQGQRFWEQDGLLEAMLQCLAYDPKKIRNIAKVLEELGDEKDSILPDGFSGLWQPVWDLCRSMEKDL